MSAIDLLFAAHEHRNVIRDTIVKTLREQTAHLSPELRALLQADQRATTGLAEALASFEPLGAPPNELELH